MSLHDNHRDECYLARGLTGEENHPTYSMHPAFSEVLGRTEKIHEAGIPE